MSFLIKIHRTEFSDVQTLGEGKVIYINDKKVEKELFSFKTLELEQDKNAVRDDCIPVGEYVIEKRYSDKCKRHFLIKDVPGRSYVLIHAANYYTQLLGCIAVGATHADINKDGYKDVTSSQTTMAKLNQLITEKTARLIITSDKQESEPESEPEQQPEEKPKAKKQTKKS